MNRPDRPGKNLLCAAFDYFTAPPPELIMTGWADADDTRPLQRRRAGAIFPENADRLFERRLLMKESK
jgi:hypothetical protein